MAKIYDFQAKKAQNDKLMEIYQELKREELRRKTVAMKKLANKLFEPYTQPKHKDFTDGIKG